MKKPIPSLITVTTNTDLISTGQVARLMGVCRRTVNNWHESKQMEADLVLPSGHLRWRLDRVLGMLAAADNDGE